MRLIGIWTGVLFIEKLRDFIEDEDFQIEILSMGVDNKVVATVKEQAQFAPSYRNEVKEMVSYSAAGTLDPKNGELRLLYEVGNSRAKLRNVEIMGILNEERGTIEGHYRLISQPDPLASFELRKVEEKPL